MAEDFLAALKAGKALPATGTAHGHVRVADGRLARVAYAHDNDPTATRRLTWLRTTLFMARWRVEKRAPRDPSNPNQWSDAGLDPRMKAHIDACIDTCFTTLTIAVIRSEWL